VQVRQVAVALVEVEAVADEELVRDREPDVRDRQVGDEAPIGTVEERDRRERGGTPQTQRAAEVVEREAGVHDVLDDQDVAAVDLRVEVLQQADARRALAVRGELEEVELVRDLERAREVGQEDEARLQRCDEQRRAARVVARDVAPELADARVDLLPGEIDLGDLAVDQLTRSSLYRSASRAMSRL
jgi:hypothetical protein